MGKAFNEQFERSNASPEVERTRHVVDELPIALFKSGDAELGSI